MSAESVAAEGESLTDDGEVWTYATAPEDKKFKWDFYFKFAPPHIRYAIQMDAVGLFSVTDMRSADATTFLIIKELKRLLAPRSNGFSVVDGTACVGGNTVSFAKHFARVTALELSAQRCGILKHNLGLFGLADKVSVVQGDFCSEFPNLPRHDAIFLDPPWGGVAYREHAKLDLFMGKQRLVDVCNDLQGKTSLIVLKLPVNFNMDGFRAEMSSGLKVLVSTTEIRKTLIVVLDARASSPSSSSSTPVFTPDSLKRPRDVDSIEKKDEALVVNSAPSSSVTPGSVKRPRDDLSEERSREGGEAHSAMKSPSSSAVTPSGTLKRAHEGQEIESSSPVESASSSTKRPRNSTEEEQDPS